MESHIEKKYDAEQKKTLRYLKASVSYNKFDFMLMNEKGFSSIEELLSKIKMLVSQYYEYVKYDEKPEKGERKAADEQALLIADLIDNFILKSGEKCSELQVKLLNLYKISLLELSYEKSSYNFDVQLNLT